MSTLAPPSTMTRPMAGESPALHTSGRRLARDIRIGMVRELRPVLRDPFSVVFSLVPIGRALKEVLPLTGQCVLLITVMIPFGFRLHLLGVVAGLALLGVLGVGMGALSYALATAVRKRDWMFWVVHQTVLFPLMIFSGVLLPLETGPDWMQAAAKANPLTWVVEAERALVAGDMASPAVAWGWVAAVLTAIVGLALVEAMDNSVVVGRGLVGGRGQQVGNTVIHRHVGR